MDGVAPLEVGRYTLPEAARIIGVSPSTLRGWVTLRQATADGSARARRPALARAFVQRPFLLSFPDLVELLVVKALRAEGVPLLTIREIAERAARAFHAAQPFTLQRFSTDEHGLLAAQDEPSSGGGAGASGALARWSPAFARAVRALPHLLDFEAIAEGTEATAIRYWPLGRQGRIVLDPQRRRGMPLDDETGVPTAALFDAVEANDDKSLATIAAWFAVPPAAVEAAVAFERGLRRERLRLSA